MVSRETSTIAVLRSAERLVVAAMAGLLPAGFRQRQRAEWTADLLEVGAAGRAAQWRYLAAALWTLPALRSFARRGVAAGTGGLRDVATPAGLRLFARVLVAGLLAPALSVLVLLLPFWSAIDWPEDPPAWLALLGWLLAWSLLLIPSIAVWFGGAWMVAWLAFVATVLGPLQRGLRPRQRWVAGLTGLSLLLLFGGFLTFWQTAFEHPGGSLGAALSWLLGDDVGGATGLLGAVSLALGWRARTLSGRMRVALLVAGVVAVALTVAHHTAAATLIRQQLPD
ncbi:hypothetical protein [Actinoplanes sp. NPDC049681]|uniref:hypothetical protein n=1 Tax=Actinoplanes sp. NPDC049681 TaxID=3363905 RepID=UPI0037A5BC23